MKISDLITRLHKLQAEHGDLQCGCLEPMVTVHNSRYHIIDIKAAVIVPDHDDVKRVLLRS